jgi:hypothetical protein
VTFADYYRRRFPHDLARVFAVAPRSHDHPDPEGRTLQLMGLSRENRAIRAFSPEALLRFATALYFTVLVDQVMYTYFRSHYDTFEALTRYPKLRGDCPGGCNSHIHPSHLFGAVNQRPGSSKADWLETFREAVREAIPVMQREVLEFFPIHLTDVDGADVWRRCCAESPLEELISQNAA